MLLYTSLVGLAVVDGWIYKKNKQSQIIFLLTSSYDSTLLGYTFLTLKVFLHEISLLFARFIHCYSSRIFDSHIVSYPSRSLSEDTSVSVLSYIDYTTCTEF